MEYCCIRAPRWRPSILSDSPNGSHFKQAWTPYTFNKLQSAHHKPQNQNEPLAVLEMVQGGCASPLCHFKRTVPKLLWQPALSSTPSQGPANNPSSQRTPPSPPGLRCTLFRKETSRAAMSSVCADIQRNRDLVSASFIITGASEFKWDSPPAWQAGTFPDSSLEEKRTSHILWLLVHLWPDIPVVRSTQRKHFTNNRNHEYSVFTLKTHSSKSINSVSWPLFVIFRNE